MAIYSGLFNSVNGDRKYNAWWFAKYFSTFIGNGVFPNPSTGLQVLENENMTTVVKPGSGWIEGYFLYSDNDYILQHDLADGVLKRIDRVVMRLNYLERQIEIDIKKGKFASSPVAPTLQRNADMHELALADVLINNGATVITQANITDARLNSELCGIVHGTVDQVDTTDLYSQYLDFWNDWRTGKMDQFEQFLIDTQDEFDQQTDNNQTTFDNQTIMNQQEFDDWFVTVQGILEGDVAGNLLTMIEQNKIALETHEEKIASETELGHIKIGDGLEIDSSGVVTTNTTELMEVIDRNFYDDYQLWLELYYKGTISGVDAYNARSIIFDGLNDSTRLVAGTFTKDENFSGVVNPPDGAGTPTVRKFAVDTSPRQSGANIKFDNKVNVNDYTGVTYTMPMDARNNARYSAYGVFDLGEVLTIKSIYNLISTSGIKNPTANFSFIVEALRISEDGVNFKSLSNNQIPQVNSGSSTSNGDRTLIASPERPFSARFIELNATYVIGGFYETSAPSLTVFQVKFEAVRTKESKPRTIIREINIDSKKATLYATTSTSDVGRSIPSLSLTGFAPFEPLTYVSSRTDRRNKYHYEHIYTYDKPIPKGSLLSIQFDLKSPTSDLNSTTLLSRYGLIL